MAKVLWSAQCPEKRQQEGESVRQAGSPSHAEPNFWAGPGLRLGPRQHLSPGMTPHWGWGAHSRASRSQACVLRSSAGPQGKSGHGRKTLGLRAWGNTQAALSTQDTGKAICRFRQTPGGRPTALLPEGKGKLAVRIQPSTAGPKGQRQARVRPSTPEAHHWVPAHALVGLRAGLGLHCTAP